MDRDSELAKRIENERPIYNGWTFDYMYPGYFSFYKGAYRIFFTPDFNDDGALSMQVQTDEGEYVEPSFDYEPSVKYKTPLDIDQMLSAAHRLADLCDKHLLGANADA